MQFGLQDIRRWGNRKALQEFPLGGILGEVSGLAERHYGKCSSPYSFPAQWGMVQGSVYAGLYTFMLYCEPMIGSVQVDAICKRRFRNMWNRVWDNIAQDFSLTDSEKELLSGFGIQLAFIAQDLGIVTRFYNFLLKWAIFSSNCLNFEKNDMTALGVVDMLVCMQPGQFVDKIIGELK